MDMSLNYSGCPIRVSQIAQPDPETIKNLHRYWRNAEDEGYLERYWAGEADHTAWIPVIRSLLAAHFPEFADAEITYFAAGTFHRLYRIVDPSSARVYLFRVAIPVDPVFKTESEVATMTYVRRHTSIPVPRVFAFSSSDNNELGHEWILMEMLPGVSLRSVWGRMPYDANAKLFVDLAEYVNELLALRFSTLGNIYFADVAGKLFPQEPSLNNPTGDADTIDIGIKPNSGFVISRIVTQEFFFDKRVHLNASRGPFQTAREWVDARLDLLRQRVQNLSVDPTEEYYCDNDRELEKNWVRIDTILRRLEDLAPHLVSPENGPEDVGVLWHDDLSEHNLLVDPKTFKLIGIIDWESVSIVPAYETHGGLLACLSDRDNKPAPLVLLARGLGDGYVYDVETKKLRNPVEQEKLRDVYCSCVRHIYDATSPVAQRRVKGKQDLSRQLEVGGFQHRPWATEHWLAENGFITDMELSCRANGISTNGDTEVDKSVVK
ncbi:hypothetical protein MFIFM68171_03605 [Madurella fahalii]|uniref:Aminoglycoside phosphotransferase domain-containing protein n=1 Tax=Madurella fahalii TaxID=1157608 RepID=A0ABQ0G740_9PEZI